MTKDPLAKFNLGNIGSGSRMRSGLGASEQRGIGWKGALHELKKPGRSSEFANLTPKDVELGGGIIEDKLRHKANYSGLNYHDLKAIHHQLETLKRSGKLSAADVQDFDDISQRLKGKS